MTDRVREIDSYLKRLFPISRSITGNGNRETLGILQEIVPLTVHEVPSGTKVYDWTIPDEWNIHDAWISMPGGERIVDFRISNLHVMSYSVPVRGQFEFSELQSHLHTHSELPEAIPYRTSYYEQAWAFCVTQAQYSELKRLNGPFEVVIDATLKPGALSYGEFRLKGRSSQDVLLSCYICHPSMANDCLSGVLLTAFLARELMARAEHWYSYRIVFVPETIGAVAYCALNEAAMKKIDLGMVITTVGGPGKFGYKQSVNKNHEINRLIEEVFTDAGVGFITYPFDIHGSDERQYSSNGFGINVATICRDKYYEYPEYHTSLDNLDFVSARQIDEVLQLYMGLIDRFEARRIYRTRVSHCEVMLSRRGLYPTRGGALTPEPNGRSELDLILWLLFLSDAKRSLSEISNYLSVAESDLLPVVKQLESKGILERV